LIDLIYTTLSSIFIVLTLKTKEITDEVDLNSTKIFFGSALIWVTGYFLSRFLKKSKEKYYFFAYPHNGSIEKVLIDIKSKIGYFSWVKDFIVFYSDQNGYMLYLKTYSLRNVFFLFDPLLPWRYISEKSAINGVVRGASGHRMIEVINNTYNRQEIAFSSPIMREKLIKEYLEYVNSN
jgi:hypothetical protein